MAGEQEEINVDELMSEIEAPSGERPMSGAEAPAQTEAKETPWSAPDWLEFEAGGQKIRPDSLDKVKTWLSQGHNYSQRAAALNAKEREWQTKLQESEQYKSKYHPVDEYARQNPEWWAHVEKQWQERQKNPNGLPPELAPLAAELGEVKSFIGQIQQEKILEQQRAEDQQLEQEVGEIRAKYPNIDLSAVDESGLTLEKRVLDHCIESGIKSFRAGFRDYLHDQLVDLAKADGKQALAKDQETRARKGILGTSPVPVKAMQKAQNVRGKSYDDLTAEALSELGLS